VRAEAERRGRISAVTTQMTFSSRRAFLSGESCWSNREGLPKRARPNQPVAMALCSVQRHQAILSRLLPSGSSPQSIQSNTLKLAFEMSSPSRLCCRG
jgi:hypothetical protein